MSISDGVPDSDNDGWCDDIDPHRRALQKLYKGCTPRSIGQNG